MNTMTARGLSLAVVVAVWTAISHTQNLPLSLWPVLVGLGCFLAAGGGIPGLQKSERELHGIVLDMHDGPVQDLFAALSQLQVLERALAGDTGTQQRTRQAMRLLERALGEIRNFIGAFRPPGFERRALGEIIEGLAVQHETLTNQAVELQLPDDLGDCVLPTKIAIYRILP